MLHFEAKLTHLPKNLGCFLFWLMVFCFFFFFSVMNSAKSRLCTQAGWLLSSLWALLPTSRGGRGALGQCPPWGSGSLWVTWRAPRGAVGHSVPGWGAGASPRRLGAGGQQGCSQCLGVQRALGHAFGLCRDPLLHGGDDIGRGVVPFF